MRSPRADAWRYRHALLRGHRGRLALQLYEDLDGLAFIHRPVAVRDSVEVGDAIEHTTGLDLPVQDVREEILDVCPPAPAHRRS